MLAIETYIQNSVSSVSGKVCAVARVIAFASIASSFDIDASQANSFGTDSAGCNISEPMNEDLDQAKQIEFWHRHMDR